MNIANLKGAGGYRASSMKPYIFDYPADFKGPFRNTAKQVFKYLCDDCYKTLSARLSPSYTRLRKAQALLNGKGGEEMDDEE